MGKAKNEKAKLAPPVTLTAKAETSFSQLAQDLRQTHTLIAHTPRSALSILDASAVEAIKGIYYLLATEDPLNAMPAHKMLHEQRLVSSTFLPLVNAVHADPASAKNQKRWSVPLYQTLRLLALLTTPIDQENEYLPPGCNADANQLQLRADLAQNPQAMTAFVALLQYYMERKAEKQEALATAESSKVEDARIETILRFFRNLLAPLRQGTPPRLLKRDVGIHLALVAALVQSDFYSTISILFASREDAHAQYTELVFLVAHIYGHTFRHSTPRQIYQYSRRADMTTDVKEEPADNSDDDADDEQPKPSILGDLYQPGDKPAPPKKPRIPQRKVPAKPQIETGKPSALRAAIQRERAYIGGSRSITTAARWTSRHSGGFCAAPGPPTQKESGAPATNGIARNLVSKRVLSSRNVIESRKSLNPKASLLEGVKLNSEILCLLMAKGRRTVMSMTAKEGLSGIMRRDLQEAGRKSIVTLTVEFIDTCFPFMVRELRDRIEERRAQSLNEDDEVLSAAQRAFVCILGSVVGFQRERYGKVFIKAAMNERSPTAELHENDMKSVLSSDYKVVRSEWSAVEVGIEVETFRHVFRILVEASETARLRTRTVQLQQDIEKATFAVLEMMKMLQGMASHVNNQELEQNFEDAEKVISDIRKKKTTLTPRELALNTLEQLFEREDFLNAPADLAKDYDARFYSFEHLTNVVEVAHVFTTILLDESELARIQVAKKRRKKKPKKAKDETVKECSKTEDGSKDEEPETRTSTDNSTGNDEDDQAGNQEAGTDDADKADDDAQKTEENKSAENEDKSGADKMDEEEVALKASAEEEGNRICNSTEHSDKKAEGKNEDCDDDSSSDDGGSDQEAEMTEIENTGIIRRFAHGKALQTLSLPMRAALCNASSLTGSIEAIPEGSSRLLTGTVIAKSAHVVACVWRVAKIRERGALCGQFFTFTMMQLLGLILQVCKKECVLKDSVLDRMGAFAKDVTEGFYTWLSVNPGLVLDMLFIMDKASCSWYATCIRNRKAMLEDKDRYESDSGNDSDLSVLQQRLVQDINVEETERRASARKEKRKLASASREKKRERRRVARAKISDDEDVDDLDALNIGMQSADEYSDTDIDGGDEKSGAQVVKSFCRMRSSKRRRKIAHDGQQGQT